MHHNELTRPMQRAVLDRLPAQRLTLVYGDRWSDVQSMMDDIADLALDRMPNLRYRRNPDGRRFSIVLPRTRGKAKVLVQGLALSMRTGGVFEGRRADLVLVTGHKTMETRTRLAQDSLPKVADLVIDRAGRWPRTYTGSRTA